MNQRKSPLLASAQVSNFESVDVKRLLLFGGKLLFTLSELGVFRYDFQEIV